LGKSDLVKLGAILASAEEPLLFAANVSRLSTEMSFIPTYDLDNGLDETIIWCQKQLN
jgi:nucleoside-diphosphate-sugar epimerase